ncbi:MAG TPA: GTPase ObgE [Polyangiaceae bacterium]|nr:GTPase ObgE [Polyangiaceae bacterium]
MRFIDECDLRVEAGNGGNGVVAFRREKYVPFGGPAGGDGGRGGDVILVAASGLGTLYDLTHRRVVRADHGANGEGKDCYGRSGKDLEVRVPVGTIAFDRETNERICELVLPNDRFVIARGGKGGRGNKHFATPVDRAPRRCEPGEAGEKRDLRLELRVMADVGLLGYPNVGKSTMISAVSRARPKVADYPFTTLEPHLGVVTLGDPRRGPGRSFVIADIPGLIPGASEGAGLGVRFLRHLERTRVLLHLLTLSDDPERTPLSDYHVIRKELAAFKPELARFPEIVAMTKADLPDVREAYPQAQADFAKIGVDLHLVSAASHDGLDALMQSLAEKLAV